MKPTTWDPDKRISDFKVVADHLRSEGQTSRADAVDYLIERVEQLTKDAEVLDELRLIGLTCITSLLEHEPIGEDGKRLCNDAIEALVKIEVEDRTPGAT